MSARLEARTPCFRVPISLLLYPFGYFSIDKGCVSTSVKQSQSREVLELRTDTKHWRYVLFMSDPPHLQVKWVMIGRTFVSLVPVNIATATASTAISSFPVITPRGIVISSRRLEESL